MSGQVKRSACQNIRRCLDQGVTRDYCRLHCISVGMKLVSAMVCLCAWLIFWSPRVGGVIMYRRGAPDQRIQLAKVLVITDEFIPNPGG